MRKENTQFKKTWWKCCVDYFCVKAAVIHVYIHIVLKLEIVTKISKALVKELNISALILVSPENNNISLYFVFYLHANV